ncbi:WD40 repeat domain-containing protein [Synechococcus moorigangaii CMS01]|nr:WD40 repeat domain-containing protein [Synechococcus moorigangaii CMS01]
MKKKQQWFEMAEFGCLLLIFFVWLWEMTQGDRQPLTTLLLWVALGLNVLNRLAQRHQGRRQVGAMLRSLEQRFQGQLQGQVQPLLDQIRRAYQKETHLAKIETDEELQEYLQSLEKALSNVVEYLKEAALAERLTNLENEFLRQQQTITPPEQAPSVPPALEVGAIADPWASDSSPMMISGPETKQRWQPLHQWQAHKDCVSTLAFSPDQRFLASGSWDHQLKLWRVEDGKQISQVTAHNQGILTVRFTPSVLRPEDSVADHYVAIASSSFAPEVKLWHLDHTQAIPQLELQHTLVGHQGAVYGLVPTSQSTLITGSHDQTLRQWQIQDGSVCQETLDLDDQIQAIALTPQENVFISGGTEGLLKFWRTTDHQLLGSLNHDPPTAIVAIAIRADGKFFASAGEQGLIHLWQLDLNDLESLPEKVPCYTLAAHEKSITQLIFSPQGHFLISGSVDGTIKIWQLGVTEPLSVLNFNEAEATTHVRLLALALSGDGRTLAAGGSDGTIKLWQQL